MKHVHTFLLAQCCKHSTENKKSNKLQICTTVSKQNIQSLQLQGKPSFLVNRSPSIATKRSFTLTKFLKVPTGNKLKGLSLIGK